MPSSINQGDLPIHVCAGREARVIDGSSTVNPIDWTTVSILSSHIVTRPKLSPTAIEADARNTEGNIVLQSKEKGMCA